MSSCRPSLLDVVGARDSCSLIGISWSAAIADHALVFFEVAVQKRTRTSHNGSWHCVDEDGLIDCFAELDDKVAAQSLSLANLPVALQATCRAASDLRRRQLRRQARLPTQARFLLFRASQASDEAERMHLKRLAWNVARSARAALAGLCVRKHVRKGGAVTKSKKLHVISAISGLNASGHRTIEDDEEVAMKKVQEEFTSRWQVGNLHRYGLIDDLLAQHRGRNPIWAESEVRSALACIGNQYRCDDTGECVAMWSLLFRRHPALVCSYFGWFAGCDSEARASEVAARGYGKSSASPLPTEIRVILPLRARAQIVDALVAQRLQCFLGRSEFKRDWLWVGAQKHSQPMEISWMLSQIIEKALDNRSIGGLAQADICAYYDHLDVLLCARWLLQAPTELVDPAVVMAALRWQMLPRVRVTTGIGSFEIGRRGGGAITGSRSAGVLGRSHQRLRADHRAACLAGW